MTLRHFYAATIAVEGLTCLILVIGARTVAIPHSAREIVTVLPLLPLAGKVRFGAIPDML
jgi:hypothetical protein